jgi:hypothetical protein
VLDEVANFLDPCLPDTQHVRVRTLVEAAE